MARHSQPLHRNRQIVTGQVRPAVSSMSGWKAASDWSKSRRRNASHILRTTSTFSCDIARPVSPTLETVPESGLGRNR
jgi:hypothetical protein